jgi:hypothetical protein
MRNALLTLILLAILAVDTAANPAGFFAGYAGARRLAVLDAWESAGFNDGLVSYWAMRTSGTTVFDEYGSNDGTAVNGVLFGSAYGKRDDGAGMPSTNEYITAATSIGASTGFAFSAWIKPDTVAGNQDFIYQTSSGAVRKFFGIRDGKLIFYYAHSTGNTFALTDNVVVSTNGWQHVFATFDAGAIGIRVNGENKAYTRTGSIVATALSVDNTAIGSRLGVSNPFKGCVDEVAIWSIYVPSGRAAAIYNTPLYAPYKQ